MTKEERSKWFYTEFKKDTKAVIVLAHGLNLLPSKMDQLAHFFNSKKCDVLRISLGNDPISWEDNFSDNYLAALEHAHILERPLYFVGYSLGALMGIHFMLTHKDHQFKKSIFLAPAIHTRFYTRLPAMLSHLFPKGNLPSLNLENYRARPATSLLEYKFMHKFQNETKALLNKEEFNLPTLLITAPKDELVDSFRLMRISARFPLLLGHEVTNKASQQPRKYHHLMIDEESLGQEEWQKMLKKMTAHLSL